jgi:hypothetical protein
MDSIASITRRIAETELPNEVKQALVTMLNHELADQSGKGATKATYLRELESLATSWAKGAKDAGAAE